MLPFYKQCSNLTLWPCQPYLLVAHRDRHKEQGQCWHTLLGIMVPADPGIWGTVCGSGTSAPCPLLLCHGQAQTQVCPLVQELCLIPFNLREPRGSVQIQRYFLFTKNQRQRHVNRTWDCASLWLVWSSVAISEICPSPGPAENIPAPHPHPGCSPPSPHGPNIPGSWREMEPICL